MLYRQLQQLKSKSGKSNKQIAEETGISESTVAKILNGESENPTWLNVIDIIRCLNGSADDIAGIEKEETVSASLISQYKDRIKALEAGYKETIDRIERNAEKQINREKEISAKSDKRFAFLFVLFSIAFIAAVALLSVDILNGGFGYFQY